MVKFATYETCDPSKAFTLGLLMSHRLLQAACPRFIRDGRVLLSLPSIHKHNRNSHMTSIQRKWALLDVQ